MEPIPRGWDEELNKFAPYRELIKHPNEEIKNRWLKSGEDEFGRLFQGFEPNGIEGMDVLTWPSSYFEFRRMPM